MTGSEKQIKWATEIVRTIGNMFEIVECKNQNSELISQVAEIHRAVIKNMNNSYAGNIIDDFGYFTFDEHNVDDSYKNFSTKLAVAAKWKKRDYRKNAYITD